MNPTKNELINNLLMLDSRFDADMATIKKFRQHRRTAVLILSHFATESLARKDFEDREKARKAECEKANTEFVPKEFTKDTIKVFGEHQLCNYDPEKKIWTKETDPEKLSEKVKTFGQLVYKTIMNDVINITPPVFIKVDGYSSDAVVASDALALFDAKKKECAADEVKVRELFRKDFNRLCSLPGRFTDEEYAELTAIAKKLGISAKRLRTHRRNAK